MTTREDLSPVPGAGSDGDARQRPGVPMETTPKPAGNAHWSTPDRQPLTVPVFKRAGLDEMTPVFGTAQPPRGLSGAMRALAYRIPEHRVSHWALLLLADRVDVGEHGGLRGAARLGPIGAGVALLALAAGLRPRQRAVSGLASLWGRGRGGWRRRPTFAVRSW